MTRNRRTTALCCALGLTLSTSACGDDPAPSPAAASIGDGSPPAGEATFRSDTFSVPLEVLVPAWLPSEPSVEEPHFLTWESPTEDRKVRMLVPVSVFVPDDAGPTPPPIDYLGYLRSQQAVGAILTDEETVDVAGRSATLLTATSERALDGGLGCQAEGMTAADCWGLQPDLLLRIAVIPLDGSTLVAWARAVRDEPGTDELFADFDEMVASLDLR